MERRIIKRYSEAFKRHMGQAYESGQQISVGQAIFLYNHDRPHPSLGYQTPQ